MPLFHIPCNWRMMGMMHVEAPTLRDAIRLAIFEAPLPTSSQSEFEDGSFAVEFECLKENHLEEYKSEGIVPDLFFEQDSHFDLIEIR